MDNVIVGNLLMSFADEMFEASQVSPYCQEKERWML